MRSDVSAPQRPPIPVPTLSATGRPKAPLQIPGRYVRAGSSPPTHRFVCALPPPGPRRRSPPAPPADAASGQCPPISPVCRPERGLASTQPPPPERTRRRSQSPASRLATNRTKRRTVEGAGSPAAGPPVGDARGGADGAGARGGTGGAEGREPLAGSRRRPTRGGGGSLSRPRGPSTCITHCFA